MTDKGGGGGNDHQIGGEPTGPKFSLLTGAVGGLSGLGYGGRNVAAQYRAEKKLDERLRRLMAGSSRSFDTLGLATPSLEVLRTLTSELAGSGE